jgi:glutathione synthase/RimK-type ligase-like ATP-grasp enzyme
MSDNKRDKLGILYERTERFSPSNQQAIGNFIEAGIKHGMHVEILSRHDIYRLPEFKVLFIRDTTHERNYTNAFALFAKALNMSCIDDCESIRKCNNKILMHKIFKKHKIPTPETFCPKSINIQHYSKFKKPFVIKEHDSSFSRGIHKVSNVNELQKILWEIKNKNLVMQEYVPTKFDWRIGIFRGEAIFACKYFMSKDDWRIIKYDRIDVYKYNEGEHETIPVEHVKKNIIELAEAAAKLFGNGLYGVDIKIVKGKPLVIEVNDNPNIDAGIEDQILGQKLYEKIIVNLCRI